MRTALETAAQTERVASRDHIRARMNGASVTEVEALRQAWVDARSATNRLREDAETAAAKSPEAPEVDVDAIAAAAAGMEINQLQWNALQAPSNIAHIFEGELAFRAQQGGETDGHEHF